MTDSRWWRAAVTFGIVNTITTSIMMFVLAGRPLLIEILAASQIVSGLLWICLAILMFREWRRWKAQFVQRATSAGLLGELPYRP